MYCEERQTWSFTDTKNVEMLSHVHACVDIKLNIFINILLFCIASDNVVEV